MTVIGLLGSKRSGKDTFADYLVNDHGFTRLAFADAMKDALLVLDPYVAQYGHTQRLGYLVNLLGWDRAKELYPEIRRLLQAFGTEVGRECFGQDVWVNAMDAAILAAVTRGQNVVVTDIRFINEMEMACQEHGAWLVRIERDGLPNIDQHASEQEWRSIEPDFTVSNNGGLENLRAEAALIVDNLINNPCVDVAV